MFRVLANGSDLETTDKPVLQPVLVSLHLRMVHSRDVALDDLVFNPVPEFECHRFVHFLPNVTNEPDCPRHCAEAAGNPRVELEFA